MNLDGLSLSPLVTEINTRLIGSRIDRIFQLDKYTLIIWLRQPGENIPLLLSANPEYPRLHITDNVPENPSVPPVFCMLLRKHLEDGRIARIEQHGLDRVVSIYIDVRGEKGLIVTKQLTIEIMGKHSNIVLVQDGIIVDAIRRIGTTLSRVRHILPGKEYTPPPGQQGANLLTTAPDAFVASLLKDRAELGLSKAIVDSTEGIGPLTAREIVWRAGLPSDMKAGSLDKDDATVLAEAVASVINPLSQGNIQPTIAVAADGSRLMGIAAFKLEHLTACQLQNYSSMSAAVEFAAGFKGKPEPPEKTLLQKLLAGEMTKLKRKETVIRQEAADAESANQYRAYGDILMTHLPSVAPGTTAITLPDLYADDPETSTVTIPLAPQYSVIDNARHLYNKYNKLKRAQVSLASQLKECLTDYEYLDSILVALDQATTFDDINEIRQELVSAGYIKEKTKRKPARPAALLTAKTPDGIPVLIGKNNRQNDQVTFKHSQPDDLWFHTKDIPGSHVILRCGGAEPSPEALTAAATLAAYFSKARQSATVPVDYTRRRNVKKPAGAKPGFVIYDHQKTLYVTPLEEVVITLIDKK